MESSNLLQPYGVVDLLEQVEITIITFMDRELYFAAAKGNIDKFRNDSKPLEGILTLDENTILHIYLKNNQDEESVSIKFVQKILQICPSLLLQANSEGEIPLHIAVINRQTNVVNFLIECAKAGTVGTEAAKEMLRTRNKENNTALHLAVLYKCFPVVQVLIKEDPHFQYSANNHGETPLSIAARKGQKTVMLEILKSCTSVDYSGPNGSTALHAAVRTHRPSPDPIKKMMEKNKSLSKKADENGWMPLHYAAYFGDSTSVDLLLEEDKSLAYIGIKETKMTALHLATLEMNWRTMKVMLDKCPDCCELVDNRGWNFLHYLAINFPYNMFIEELTRLFKDYPSLRYLLIKKDNKDTTPLQILAAYHEPKAYHEPISSFLQGNIDFEEAFFLSSMKQEEILEMTANVDYGRGPEGQIVRKRAISSEPVNGKADRDLTQYKHVNTQEEEIISEPVNKEAGRELKEAGRELKEAGIDLKEVGRNIKKELGDGEEDKESNEAERDLRQSHLVVAALIATVTFAAGFTLPGGTEKGIALLRKSRAFQAFIVTDAIAMTLSTFSIFIQFIMALDRDIKKYWEELLVFESIFTLLALGAMVLAFVTGVYAVLAPTLAIAIITSCIGLSYFVFVSYSFYMGVKKMLLHMMADMLSK